MGYKIIYDKPAQKSGLLWLSLLFFLLFALCVRLLFPEFSELLLAGKVSDAISSMTEQLSNGSEIMDAVQTFCQEILDGA